MELPLSSKKRIRINSKENLQFKKNRFFLSIERFHSTRSKFHRTQSVAAIPKHQKATTFRFRNFYFLKRITTGILKSNSWSSTTLVEDAWMFWKRSDVGSTSRKILENACKSLHPVQRDCITEVLAMHFLKNLLSLRKTHFFQKLYKLHLQNFIFQKNISKFVS